MVLKTTGTALLFLALTGAAGTALAGPAADSANQHFKAIGAGDIEQLARSYAGDAILQWVGGPLDGVYSGEARLRELWSKFTAAQGKLDVQVGNLQESANPRGATVTANVEFKGKAAIKVRYVLTYRDGRIVNEVWQIDPNLAVGY